MSEHIAETHPEKDVSDNLMLESPKKTGLTENQRKKENRRRRSYKAIDVVELKETGYSEIVQRQMHDTTIALLL